MGASSRSPSPITTVPRMFNWLNALRMASTAAWSASFSSPRPITRAEAIAAASVSRTASSPMFLSISLSLQSLQQPVRRPRRPQLGPHADMHGMPEREQRVIRLAVHLVLETNLHPGMRVRQVHDQHVIVLRRFQIPDGCLEHRGQDPAPLDLAVGEPEVADEVAARALEEAQVVGVVDHAHLVGVAVEDADAIGIHAASCITAPGGRRPAAAASVPAAGLARPGCW